MLCPHCGNEMPDESKVCPACGEEVTSAPTEEVAETVTHEEETPKKKKFRFPIKWLITAVVAVVAVVALILNMDTIVGTVIKIFGSDTAYYRYVELNSLKSNADTMSGYYGMLLNTLDNESQKVDGTARLVVGEDVLELLQEREIDIGFLNELELSFSGNVKDQKASLDLALSLADGDPFALAMILDSVSGNAFLSVPSVKEEYVQIGADLTQTFGLPVTVTERLKEPTFAKELVEVLPTEREVNELLDRYATILLDEVEVRKAEETTLTIEDVQQTCTALEIDITKDVLERIANAVLKEAEADEKLRGYLTRVQTFLEERGLIENTDLNAAFIQALEDGFDRADDMLKDATDKRAAVITTYVSQTHRILGRRITTEKTDILVASVQKSNRYATKVSVKDRFSLVGSGTVRGNVKTGEYMLTVDGVDTMEIALTDVDFGKAAAGYLNGKVRFTPKRAMFERLGLDREKAITAAFMNLSLEIGLETDKVESHIELSLCKDEMAIIGVVIDMKNSRGETVELPENAVELADREAVEAWLDSFKGETVLDKLQNAGLPQEVVELLKNYKTFIPMGGQGSNED